MRIGAIQLTLRLLLMGAVLLPACVTRSSAPETTPVVEPDVITQMLRIDIYDGNRPPPEYRRSVMQIMAVNSIAYSPDGTTLAAGIANGTIRLYDAVVGKERQKIHVDGHVNAVAYSSDGKTLAAGGSGSIHLWETATYNHILTIEGHKGPVYNIAYSPDSKILASGGVDGMLCLWSVDTGKQIASIVGRGPVHSFAFSPNGKTIAFCGSWDNIIYLIDVDTGKERLRFDIHEGTPLCVDFSADGNMLASGSWDKTIRIWDSNTGIELIKFNIPEDPAWSVSYSPSRNILALRNSGKISFWNLAKREKCLTVNGHEGSVTSYAFSRDWKRLATCHFNLNALILIWDVEALLKMQK